MRRLGAYKRRKPKEWEKRTIMKALKKFDTKKEAAEYLRVTPRGLRKKIKRLAI